MRAIKVVQGETLDMFEYVQPQIFQRAVADSDGAADLCDREPPVEDQVRKVDRADDADATQGDARIGEISKIAIDSELNEFRAEQLRPCGKDGKDEVERKCPAIGDDVARQAPKSRSAHPLLFELFFQQDVVGVGHIQASCTCSRKTS